MADSDVWDRLDQHPDSSLVAFFADFEHIFQEGTSFIESDLLATEIPSALSQSVKPEECSEGRDGSVFIIQIYPDLFPGSSSQPSFFSLLYENFLQHT